MASPTQWTWVWVDSGSWWWTGRPVVIWSMGSRRVGLSDWTELSWIFCFIHMPHSVDHQMIDICFHFLAFMNDVAMIVCVRVCSVMSNSSRPHGPYHNRPPCPSPTPRVYSNSCPLSWRCHPTLVLDVFKCHNSIFCAFYRLYIPIVLYSNVQNTKHCCFVSNFRYQIILKV